MRPIRALIVLILVALGTWVGRLLAHSKLPQPEGRWREIGPDDLGAES